MNGIRWAIGMALMVGLVLAVGLRSAAPQPGPDASDAPADRAVILYVAHDNNLSDFTASLLAKVGRAIGGAKPLPVVVITDIDGGAGLTLHEFAADGTAETRAVSATRPEDSAAPATVESALAQAIDAAPAERYLLGFVGHGEGSAGLLRDARPTVRGKPSTVAPTRIGPAAIAEILDRLDAGRKATRFDTLLLQLCGGADIDTLTALGHPDRWIVASPADVDVRNNWYAGVFDVLGTTPDMPAEDLARAIVAAEDARIFTQLVAVNGAALAELPGRVDRLKTQLAEAAETAAAAGDLGPEFARRKISLSAEPATIALPEGRPALISLAVTSHGPVEIALLDEEGSDILRRRPSNGTPIAIPALPRDKRVRLTVRAIDPRRPTIPAILHWHAGHPLRPRFHCPDGPYADLIAWLRHVASHAADPTAHRDPIDRFDRWLRTTLCPVTRLGSRVRAEQASAWCGITIALPE